MRRFAEWWKDYGLTTRCCQRATAEELRDEPERYDCRRCALKGHLDGLWTANKDAWRIYQALGRRTVGLCGLHGLMLERLTDGWDAEDVVDLIARLDVILDVMEPKHGA